MELDCYNNLTRYNLVANGTHSADAKSTPYDVSPFIGNLMVLADVGAPTSSPNSTLGIWVQTTAGTLNPDSLTAQSETDWYAAGTFTSCTTAASSQAISLDTRALGKYIRSNMDFAGFTSGVRPVCVKVIGQKNTY